MEHKKNYRENKESSMYVHVDVAPAQLMFRCAIANILLFS